MVASAKTQGTLTPALTKKTGASAGIAAINPYLAVAKVGYDLFAGYKAGQQRQAVSNMNARTIRQEGETSAQAIEESARRLGEDQRGLKATQRMSVASRGGLMGGTDLLTLADEAEKMQLDQLELMRQRDVTKEKARYSAYLTKFQAKQQARAGFGATLARWTKHVGKAYIGDFSGT
jgi:hypothetical protein